MNLNLNEVHFKKNFHSDSAVVSETWKSVTKAECHCSMSFLVAVLSAKFGDWNDGENCILQPARILKSNVQLPLVEVAEVEVLPGVAAVWLGPTRERA